VKIADFMEMCFASPGHVKIEEVIK